jgi:caa(3)-type oxidase subunit IV
MSEVSLYHIANNKHLIQGPKLDHILPVWVYWLVFGLLLVLTVMTVAVASYDFGSLSTMVALFVAAIKASLVCSIFMHLWFDSKFYTLILSSSLLFLSLFLLFPLLDDDSRGLVDHVRDNFLPRDQQVYEYELQNPGALPLRPGLKLPEKDKLIFIRPHGHE